MSPYFEEDRVKDPVLLFGKLYNGGYENILDKGRVDILKKKLADLKFGNGSGEVIIVYGYGFTIKSMRYFYDYIIYFDVTPKRVILRAKNGLFENLGDLTSRPIKELIRRCYYVDFEIAGRLRRDFLESSCIDYYVASEGPMEIKLISNAAFLGLIIALSKIDSN